MPETKIYLVAVNFYKIPDLALNHFGNGLEKSSKLILGHVIPSSTMMAAGRTLRAQLIVLEGDYWWRYTSGTPVQIKTCTHKVTSEMGKQPG